MNLTDALERLDELVNPDTSPTLSEADLQAALDASLIPDAAGVWPGQRTMQGVRRLPSPPAKYDPSQ